jgi:hypothetical protein
VTPRYFESVQIVEMKTFQNSLFDRFGMTDTVRAGSATLAITVGQMQAQIGVRFLSSEPLLDSRHWAARDPSPALTESACP